jgi:hypothetical protein
MGESQLTELHLPIHEPHTQNALHSAYPECTVYGIHPISLILQDGTQQDLIENSPVISLPEDRPFVVLRAAHNDPALKEVILKMRFDEIVNDPRNSAVNEMYFVRDAVPLIEQALPDSLKQKTHFTSIVDMHPDKRSFVSFPIFEGKLIGDVHALNPESPALLSDVIQIIDVLNTIHTVGPTLLTNPHFTFSPSDTRSEIYIKYSADLTRDTRRNVLIQHLGLQRITDLEKVLEDNHALLTRRQDFFIVGDTNPSNFIRDQKGALCMFDWERMGKTNNPAYDYVFLFTDAWTAPDVQDQIIKYIIDTNSTIPDFQEYFRLDFIFNRGTGELAHWLQKRDSTADMEFKKGTQRAIDRLTSLLMDAINFKGIWKK